jgi:hypothetical protein
MLTDQDVLAIDEGILRACLVCHAKVGFSGELEFAHDSLLLLTARSNVHVEDAEIGADAERSVELRWPSIRGWLRLRNASLTVYFRQGRITKSQIRSETRR